MPDHRRAAAGGMPRGLRRAHLQAAQRGHSGRLQRPPFARRRPCPTATGGLVAWFWRARPRSADRGGGARQPGCAGRRGAGDRGGPGGARRRQPAAAGSYRHRKPAMAARRHRLQRPDAVRHRRRTARQPVFRAAHLWRPAFRQLRGGFLGQEPGRAARRAGDRAGQPVRPADGVAHHHQCHRLDLFPGDRVSRPAGNRPPQRARCGGYPRRLSGQARGRHCQRAGPQPAGGAGGRLSGADPVAGKPVPATGDRAGDPGRRAAGAHRAGGPRAWRR